MKKEYLIAFSSFYKAAYAKDMLNENGFAAALRRLPAELARSCSTGVYMKSGSEEDIADVFERKQIVPRGIYEIYEEPSGEKQYYRIR